MNRSKQQILFLVIALAIGISFPYLLDMAGRALEPQTPSSAPLGELTPAQRLESACVAVQQLNNKLNRKDPDRLSFFGELKSFQKVRPELQEVHRLVCGK